MTAFAMGWRPSVSLPMLAAALFLALFIGWATSWIFALVGLLVKNAELIGSLSMMIILVLTFLSNAFVPIKTLPGFIQAIVNVDPVSYTVTAIRAPANRNMGTACDRRTHLWNRHHLDFHASQPAGISKARLTGCPSIAWRNNGLMKFPTIVRQEV